MYHYYPTLQQYLYLISVETEEKEACKESKSGGPPGKQILKEGNFSRMRVP
jgi:hypothetical protein